MDGQRQFYRNVTTNGIWCKNRTATKQVGHQGTHVEVVAIVVLAILATIYLVRHSCPLCIISCAFQTTGQSAGFAPSFYVTHTTAKADGISRDYAFVLAEVGYYDLVSFAASLVKIKCTQIDPCESAHLLVDLELSLLTLVVYGIESIVNTLCYSLIADVYSIASCFRDGGLIGDGALPGTVVRGFCHACRTGHEGIVLVLVSTLMHGKSLTGRRFP